MPGQKAKGFTTVGKPKMATKQYNSPMAMYSEEIIEEIMTQVTKFKKQNKLVFQNSNSTWFFTVQQGFGSGLTTIRIRIQHFSSIQIWIRIRIHKVIESGGSGFETEI
jgi:hypothetical protein